MGMLSTSRLNATPNSKQHQDRHSQRHSQTARIAQNMAPFLARDGDGAAKAHTACGSRSAASIMATKTSSMLGSIGSSRSTVMPASFSAALRRAIHAASSSTVM
jgi:hypothetical protein